MFSSQDPELSKFPMLSGTIFAPSPSFPPSSTPLEQKLSQSLKAQGQIMKQIIGENQSLYLKLKELKKDIAQLQIQCREGSPLQDFLTEKPNNENVVELVCRGRQEFDWSLQLVKGMASPLCKGKYFHFKVRLVSVEDAAFPTEERVQLMAAVYSADSPPKPILHNMTGGAMLKGYPESLLSYDSKAGCHMAQFKVQLNEVTSHFRHGWIFLVVQPKYAHSDSFDTLRERIKPLVVDNLVIKAKETTCKRWRQGQQSEASDCSDSS